MKNQLRELYGNIDIYLFDQLLKGRFDMCKRIIDIGCGTGRNLPYFVTNHFDVYGIDRDTQAIELAQELCCDLRSDFQPAQLMVGSIEQMPFDDAFFDVVICSAVLHFAENEQHFEQMLQSCWRVLKPGGFFFARLASDIGIEHLVKDLGHRRYLLPDTSHRFLVNQELLLDYTHKLGGILFEPIKTTNVQNLRCMTTWCMQKV